MPRLFWGRSKVVLFILLPVFVSSACQILTPGSPASTPTPAPGTQASPASAAASQPATATAPAGTVTPPPTATPAGLVFGTGSLVITDTRTGLAALSAYTGTLTYAFAGTRDGKPEQWSKTYVLLARQDPAARQLTITTAVNGSDPEVVFMAETGGVAYERQGPDDCTASVLAPGDSPTAGLEPAGILNSVIGADKAGSETVNGVPADHYTFDERALGGLGIAKSTGELWLATPGGYLVKYVLTTRGDAQAFGSGVEGTLTWDYELTGANQPVAIQVPADCPAGLVNAPLLPDAANVHKLPGLLTFDTTASLADAAAFYQQQLPGLGWTQVNEPLTDTASVVLDYAEAGQNLTVMVMTDPAGTAVSLALERVTP